MNQRNHELSYNLKATVHDETDECFNDMIGCAMCERTFNLGEEVVELYKHLQHEETSYEGNQTYHFCGACFEKYLLKRRHEIERALLELKTYVRFSGTRWPTQKEKDDGCTIQDCNDEVDWVCTYCNKPFCSYCSQYFRPGEIQPKGCVACRNCKPELWSEEGYHIAPEGT